MMVNNPSIRHKALFPGEVALGWGAFKFPWEWNCESILPFPIANLYQNIGGKGCENQPFRDPNPPKFWFGFEKLGVSSKSDEHTKMKAPLNKQRPPMNFRICPNNWRRSLNSICGRRKPPRTLGACGENSTWNPHLDRVVATQLFWFSPRKLGKWSILTNIFQMGWNSTN